VLCCSSVVSLYCLCGLYRWCLTSPPLLSSAHGMLCCPMLSYVACAARYNAPCTHVSPTHARMQIQNVGMPAGLPPMVFAFTGDGNVSRGAQEIFNLFPHEYIEASELAALGACMT
jgi:hypothetical protein